VRSRRRRLAQDKGIISAKLIGEQRNRAVNPASPPLACHTRTRSAYRMRGRRLRATDANPSVDLIMERLVDSGTGNALQFFPAAGVGRGAWDEGRLEPRCPT
jgi:hypothetical protein